MLQGVTEGYKGVLGFAKVYKGLQRFTRGDKRLLGVTGDNKFLQRVTRSYEKGLQRVTGG